MPTNLALALFGLAYVAEIGGGIWYLVDLTKTAGLSCCGAGSSGSWLAS